MRTPFVAAMVVLVVVVFPDLPSVASSRHIARTNALGRHHHHRHTNPNPRTLAASSGVGSALNPESYRWVRRPAKTNKAGSKPDTLQVAGSSLPDCSHACGSCFPCRLVMVSFVCSTLEEAETCPMAYKCMCRSKSFPVP